MSGSQYFVDFYRSPESVESSCAPTHNEKNWETIAFNNKKAAIDVVEDWVSGNGYYKTCRVREVTGGKYTVRGSHYTDTVNQEEEKMTSQSGETVKLLIWADRRDGHPDHWDWLQMFSENGVESNQWDLVYGREVDTNGRNIRWSIRLNVWHGCSLSDWDWVTFLGLLSHEAWKVECVLTNGILPRDFPSGTEISICYNCEKKVPTDTCWHAYNPDDEIVQFCSCFCIDTYEENEYGSKGDIWRVDPDGEEHEDPGCKFCQEISNAA